ncbi:ATV_HP_G0025720.mRNA.1.CDS.1 [Saccharomyces cerevisiae]|nr:ATV_HP_G0025720.mRNA.1.CDS.1 [Saccharomyces cerevisiae]CAI6961332.1 ATV_HP_G0025720.mRNA.1.CDS.1 [Saccharomyces cerevisiae]
MSDSSNTGQDLAHFLTGMLVTSGIALPVVFYHCQLIGHLSCIMCMIGGLIIYSSIVIFKWFFKKDFNEDDSLFG